MEQQPGSEIGDVGTVGQRGTKNSSRNRSCSLHTSLADNAFSFASHGLGIPADPKLIDMAQQGGHHLPV